jgi:hypothetical protein
MLAFEPNDISHAAQVSFMFRDYEGSRFVQDNHSGHIDISALVILGTRILRCPDGDVG